jgi:hypothetical protein
MEPIRVKRNEFASDISKVNDILVDGANKAGKIASQTFANARSAVGF